MSQAAATGKKNTSWPKVGTIRKGDSGQSYIKLEANVDILVDGVKVPLNDKRTLMLDDPRKKVEMLRDRGHITEAEADKRLESLANNLWLKYDIVANPPR